MTMTTKVVVAVPADAMKRTRDEIVSGLAALGIRENDATTVQFTLGTTVVGALGLYDAELVAIVAPSLVPVKGYVFAASRSDAAVILNDLLARAEGGKDGAGHSKSERHAVLQSARRLLAVLQDSVSTVAAPAAPKSRKVKVTRKGSAKVAGAGKKVA